MPGASFLPFLDCDPFAIVGICFEVIGIEGAKAIVGFLWVGDVIGKSDRKKADMIDAFSLGDEARRV